MANLAAHDGASHYPCLTRQPGLDLGIVGHDGADGIGVEKINGRRQAGSTIALFAICLVAVVVQMVYTMILAGGLQVMVPSGAVMPALVIVIAAALLWFSWFARSRSWLGQVSPAGERE